GMNFDTERRTKAVLVARSRSQRFVERARRALRAILILRIADCGLRIDCLISEDARHPVIAECAARWPARDRVSGKSAFRNPHSAMSCPQSAMLQESPDHPAVDLDRRAIDVRGGVGEEKCADPAELVGPS